MPVTSARKIRKTIRILHVWKSADPHFTGGPLTLLVGWQEGHPACKKWGMTEGVWVNDASVYRPIGAHSQTAGDGRRFWVTACNLSKVANCIVLSVLGLLVVTDRCVVYCLMYSHNYFDDDTSTVRHRSRRIHTFSTELVFIDNISTVSQFIF